MARTARAYINPLANQGPGPGAGQQSKSGYMDVGPNSGGNSEATYADIDQAQDPGQGYIDVDGQQGTRAVAGFEEEGEDV